MNADLQAAEARCEQALQLLQEKDHIIAELEDQLEAIRHRTIARWATETIPTPSSDVVAELVAQMEEQQKELELLRAAKSSWEDLQGIATQLGKEKQQLSLEHAATLAELEQANQELAATQQRLETAVSLAS
eukprot:TRINITY_DN7675_c0_g1_i1.p4 TRINITY_DN7675_c0_g1~~TRINITY_DN7675_c0_g1_i1.p4  ORF type:complete len:132 (+),score=46.31 TRINITY_DN7675_c0_g1_i1:131-526(+)